MAPGLITTVLSLLLATGVSASRMMLRPRIQLCRGDFIRTKASAQLRLPKVLDRDINSFSLLRLLSRRRPNVYSQRQLDRLRCSLGDDCDQFHGPIDTIAKSQNPAGYQGRRACGVGLLLAGGCSLAKASGAYEIHPELAPDSTKYDATDALLYEASLALQDALNAPDVQTEERLWTKVIDSYGGSGKNWTNDIIGRAYGNRGNARSRQGNFDAALADYDTSIQMCPWAVDPVLNKGVTLEAMGKYEEAIMAYQSVLKAKPNDPAGWNNLGNANMALGQYQDAIQYYGNAAQLAPEFSFAQANQAIAVYASGDRNGAVRKFRALLRRYPDFDDMRAALVAGLWTEGLIDKAEAEWLRVGDERYYNLQWLKKERRWPQPLLNDMQSFLQKRG